MASGAGARYAPEVEETADAAVAPLTTLRVGPVAERLIRCHTAGALIEVASTLPVADPDEPVLVLGGGSNVLVSDELTGLTVVQPADRGITVEGPLLCAQAGAGWDDVVQAALAHGLGGLECLSGIPGSAGASPVQNVGAYGVEVSDTVTRVRLLDRRDGRDRWVPAADLGLAYRHSRLKGRPELVVLAVEFRLDPQGRSAPVRYGELAAALGVSAGERADPQRVRDTVLALRSGKGMVSAAQTRGDHDTWSAGSFFTNPVVSPELAERVRRAAGSPVPSYPAPGGVKLAAGWLVEHAGFGRGHPGPGAAARLSTKHALAVTNRGAAGSAELVALARTVRDGVRDAFGIDLVPEPVLVGCAL